MWFFIKPLLEMALKVITYPLSLPLGVVLGVPLALWVAWSISEGSAVKAAIKSQAAEFIQTAALQQKEAELRAFKAREAFLQRALDKARQLRASDQEALADLTNEVQAKELEKQEMENELAAIRANRQGEVPTVGDLNIIDQLRNGS